MKRRLTRMSMVPGIALLLSTAVILAKGGGVVAQEVPVVRLCFNESSGELKAVAPGEECERPRYEVTLAAPDCGGPWSVLTGGGDCLDLSAVIASLQGKAAGLPSGVQIQTRVRDRTGSYVEADTPPGAGLIVGETAQWKYLVTNVFHETLFNIVVRNSLEHAVVCTVDSLPPGESVECGDSSTVVEGELVNLGTVQAIAASPAGDAVVVAENPAYLQGGYEKTVFVSSWVFSGRLGGIDGADEYCNILAERGALPGSYKAWLATGPGDSPAQRFTRTAVTYVLPNGTAIAHGWADLTDGVLAHPIDIDEYGRVVSSSSPHVWTNVAPNGTPLTTLYSYTCNGWSTTLWRGYVGNRYRSDPRWTYDELERPYCYETAHLYCFEQ